MFIEIPKNLILFTLGAFLLGWVLSSISVRMSDRLRAKRRDPRDDRIRALEAELRVAQTDATHARDKLERTERELDDANDSIEKRDNVISHQQSRVEELKRDLKDSVTKTRELRSELTERATESVKSEAKLREVETELSIAQASTDLIATGVLDYSVPQDESPEGANEEPEPADPPKEAGTAKN